MTSKTHATAIPQTYKVLGSGTLPDGEAYIHIDCRDYSAFTALPDGMEFDGKTYGKTGWNSDTGLAYYKAGAPLARARF